MHDFTEINEAEVIGPLMDYKPFARYYRRYRPRIAAAGPVAFGIKPDLVAAGMCSCGYLENAEGQRKAGWLILLRHRPASLDDALIVAHELHHAALDVDGWPTLQIEPGAPPGLRHFGMFLNSLLDVPIDRALKAAGFATDPDATLAHVARCIGGPKHVGVLRRLRKADLTSPQATAALMQSIIAGAPGGALSITRNWPCP